MLFKIQKNHLFSELRTLHVRQNELSFLPESVAECKQLKVIDLAENELLFLPHGVKNLDLRAIWLSENQNKPLVSFHEELMNVQVSHFLTVFYEIRGPKRPAPPLFSLSALLH